MIPILTTFLNLLFSLIRGLARFLRVPRSLPTPAEAFSAPPAPVPSAIAEIAARLDAQIAEFDQWEREYKREQRAYRKLLREQARARGQLPPAKPRKPRDPKPKSPPITPPQALPETPPTLTAAPKPNPLPQTHFQAQPAAISSRPTPSKATTPPRTLFKTLSTIFTSPLRLLNTALLALQRLTARLFFRRRPPPDGPPAALPAAPSLQNRAA